MKVRGPDGRKVKLQDDANVAGFVIDKRLTSQMLSRVNFEGATLNGRAFWKGENDGIGSFYGCNFRDAKISIEGDITYTNCFQIDFSGSCFDGAILTNIHFGTCDFRDVSFKGADLSTCKFTFCNFSRTDFTGAIINESSFKRAIDDDEFSVAGISLESRQQRQEIYGSKPTTFTGVSFPMGGGFD